MTKRKSTTTFIDHPGSWDSGWLAGHSAALGTVLGKLRALWSYTPEQGRKLLKVIADTIEQHHARLRRGEINERNWEAHYVECFKATWAQLKDESKQKIREVTNDETSEK